MKYSYSTYKIMFSVRAVDIVGPNMSVINYKRMNEMLQSTLLIYDYFSGNGSSRDLLPFL